MTTSGQAVEFSIEFGKTNNPFTWTHITCDSEFVNTALSKLALPKAAKEGLIAEETRPKSVAIENGLLICLRAINFNSASEPDDMVSLRLWLCENCIVSATKKNRGLRSVIQLKNDIGQGKKVSSLGDWLFQLLDKITDKISDEVEMMENRIEAFEELLNTDPEALERQNIINTRKQAAQIKRFISPQREALDALQFNAPQFSQIESFRIKEQSDRLLRYLDTLEVFKERCSLIQDELRHITAEKQSDRMYVLSLVTAIFLPLSFLTGIFGMNVAGLPGVEYGPAFNILMGGMVTIAVLIFVIMKLKKWW